MMNNLSKHKNESNFNAKRNEEEKKADNSKLNNSKSSRSLNSSGSSKLAADNIFNEKHVAFLERAIKRKEEAKSSSLSS